MAVDFFPQMLLVFWSVSVIKIGQELLNKYQWRDLSSLILLFTIF